MYNKIIILCLAGIGDTVLFMPTLEEITKNYPNSKIDVLVMYKPSKEILENSYKNIKVIWFDFMNENKFSSIKLMRKIKNNNYDLCITSYPSNRWEYNLIAYLTRAKKRIAHNYFIGNKILYGRFLQTNLVKQNTKKQKYLHNVYENLKILKELGIEIPKNPEIKIKINPDEKKFAEEYLKKIKVNKKDLIIGIHAGTGETKNLHKRRWSIQKFAKLIDLLILKENAKIFIFGGPNEKNLKEKIKNYAKKKNSIFLINDTTMMQSIAIMNKTKLFISNDSALMHIASALKKPIIAIFGPTNTEWVYPFGTKYTIVSKNLKCAPCYFYSRMKLSCPAKKNFECMNIEPEKVFSDVKKLLKQTN